MAHEDTALRLSREARLAATRGAAAKGIRRRIGSDLFFLHESEGNGEREPQLGVGEAPARDGFDPAQPVGDRVAMDAERRGGLADTTVGEQRAEGLETLTADIRPRVE